MKQVFHAGELAVQARAGVGRQAARVGGSIHPTVPEAARVFLEQRSWIVIATAAADGRPWASFLAGPPGFARVLDPGTVRLDAKPLPGDPLQGTLDASRFVGLLAIDLAARRRMRLNGRLERDECGAVLVRADQVYSNCPKYIQRRIGVGPGRAPGPARRTARLTEEQRGRIRRADTFFIATVNPAEGADASHRGGVPGFVAVDRDRLVWPDYAGNLMYNTLGNIAAHPRAGLLFPDFESGSVLQVTGRAAIDWDGARAAAVPGAERLVELELDEVVEIEGALPGRLELVEYSPFNPRRHP